MGVVQVAELVDQTAMEREVSVALRAPLGTDPGCALREEGRA